MRISFVSETADICTEAGIKPIEEPPIETRICVIEVPVLEAWHSIADHVAGDKAQVLEICEPSLGEGGLREESFVSWTERDARDVGKMSHALKVIPLLLLCM